MTARPAATIPARSVLHPVPLTIALIALSMTMMPSPRMISVSNPILSTRCVFLKLTTLQTLEVPIMAEASNIAAIYQPM